MEPPGIPSRFIGAVENYPHHSCVKHMLRSLTSVRSRDTYFYNSPSIAVVVRPHLNALTSSGLWLKVISLSGQRDIIFIIHNKDAYGYQVDNN